MKKKQKIQYRKESDLKTQILHYLSFRGIFAWNNRNVGVWNAKTQRYIPSQIHGVSDIIGILPDGRFLAIEVKIGYNKPTEAQKNFIETIQKYNGVAFVAYSIDDVEANLHRYLKKKES